MWEIEVGFNFKSSKLDVGAIIKQLLWHAAINKNQIIQLFVYCANIEFFSDFIDWCGFAL